MTPQEAAVTLRELARQGRVVQRYLLELLSSPLPAEVDVARLREAVSQLGSLVDQAEALAQFAQER